MLRLDERRNDIDVSSKQESLRKTSVLDRVRGYVSSKAAAVLTMAAVLGGVNEAKADTGTVDDIYRVADLNSSTPGALTLDMRNGGYTLEMAINNGGSIEINQNYSAKIRLGSNKRDLQFIDNSGTVVETHTFSVNLTEVNPITSLGNDTFMLRASGKVYFFKGADIGTVNGVVFNESVRSSAPELVTHLNKHPQTGDIVGVTLAGGLAEPAVFFSYGLGDFTASHPVAGSDILVDEALKNIGVRSSDGQTVFVGDFVSGVMPNGDVRFVYEDANGNYQQWINPETDEVVAPTPEINAPAEFVLNYIGVEKEESLDIEVSDMPEGGRVVLDFGGDEFDFANSSSSDFSLKLERGELMTLKNGIYNGLGTIKVLDNASNVVATQEISLNIDIVPPKQIEFGIDGARVEDISGLSVNIIESSVIPTTVTIGCDSSELEGIANAHVISLPLSLISMRFEDFIDMTPEDQKEVLTNRLNFDTAQGQIFLSGSISDLGEFKSLVDGTATLNVEEGDYIIGVIGLDAADNYDVSVQALRVVEVSESCEDNPNQDQCQPVELSCDEDPSQEKCEPVEESCDVNPDQAKCAPVEVSCDEDPSQDKCEIDDPKNPNNPVTPNNPGNGGGEEGGGCAVPGSAPAAPGKAPLALLGMLAALGLGRRKKINKKRDYSSL